jgi:hypothetical protein
VTYIGGGAGMGAKGWREGRADHGRAGRGDESLLLWKAVVLLPPRARPGYMLMILVQGL